MSELPKVERTISHLDESESLHNTTVKLLSGVLLSAGLIFGVTPATEAKPNTPVLTARSSAQGNPIVLTPATQQMAGSALFAGHSSHSSHMSHMSHRSHYSSR